MPPQAFYDISQFDYDKPLFDLREIQKVNPQRHEMEQLTGIVYVDRENDGLVGFKDVTDDEFWVRGHMPGFPLMPGVILCECAAQLAGFYAQKYDVLGAGDFLGFGGMTDVRFRGPCLSGVSIGHLCAGRQDPPQASSRIRVSGVCQRKNGLQRQHDRRTHQS